jgi:hypothetical protein
MAIFAFKQYYGANVTKLGDTEYFYKDRKFDNLEIEHQMKRVIMLLYR